MPGSSLHAFADRGLCEIGACLAQRLVGLPLLAKRALKFFDLVALGTGGTIAPGAVTFSLTNPDHQRVGDSANFGCNRCNRRVLRSARFAFRAFCVPRVLRSVVALMLQHHASGPRRHLR